IADLTVLLDLESSTLHISKRPVFLSDQNYSLPVGSEECSLSVVSEQSPVCVGSPESHQEVNGDALTQVQRGTETFYLNRSILQNQRNKRLVAQPPGARSRSPDPALSPGSKSEPTAEDEHIYSLPVKPKPSDSPIAMASLGSNLSELDRLLLELNTVDHGTSAFTTPEEAAPPLPSTSILLQAQENGVEKPKRGAAGQGEERPSVESLLDQLETSVPLVVSEDPSDPCSDPSLELSSQQTSRMSASSATRELDELMASLSDFKAGALSGEEEVHWEEEDGTISPMTEGSWLEECLTPPSSCPGTPDVVPAAPPNKLDNMLGSLQSDLNRLGVQTVAKGVCGACKKPIVGQVVTAMGRTWHPEHFVCSHCQEEIGSRNFFERDGAPYCERDYHQLFSPRCHYCNGPILDKVVTALDKTWHPEHFFCAQCGDFFGPDGFHEKDGKAFCMKDYFEMFAPKCGGCSRAILENYISALNALWHPECFVCRECYTPFINGSFFDHEGLPFCEAHYHERRGSLCSGCQRPITGRCITAMSKKFHPEHFVCAFCLKQLNKGTFKEQQDKPYCHTCFSKLFS
uniref:LIM zinc-binding domain-containing protein n=1 Tax=Periophthalmus magnuspinnatus TaxID=409849 RepID=A0A3B3ZYQ2_9GOBI